MITSLIVAASLNDVIGAAGALPWYLPEDLRRFRRLTSGHPVVVGRVTHDSITARLGRPLPDRTSVVVSSRPRAGTQPGVVWTTSLDSAMSAARTVEASTVKTSTGELSTVKASTGDGEIFVIGGASVYQQAFGHIDRIYLTRVHREVDGDTAMPAGWLDGFSLVAREDGPAEGNDGAYSWLEYLREPS